jgi:mono/diheme cytochrome c family protein
MSPSGKTLARTACLLVLLTALAAGAGWALSDQGATGAQPAEVKGKMSTAQVRAAAGEAASAEAQMEAYQIYRDNCLACHANVADPERPGRTRDAWTVVVQYMDRHYVDLSQQEAQKVIDLLYALRKGLEGQPG